MALIVEDGLTDGGVPDAESYVTVAFADEYWAARNRSEWSALGAPAKEAALLDACAYLDSGYEWIGTRRYSTQYLNWPRAVMGYGTRVSGISFDLMLPGINEVPLALKRAQCELAMESLNGRLAEAFDPRTQAVASETVGPVSVSYFNTGARSRSFPLVDMLLKDIATGRNINGINAQALRG